MSITINDYVTAYQSQHLPTRDNAMRLSGKLHAGVPFWLVTIGLPGFTTEKVKYNRHTRVVKNLRNNGGFRVCYFIYCSAPFVKYRIAVLKRNLAKQLDVRLQLTIHKSTLLWKWVIFCQLSNLTGNSPPPILPQLTWTFTWRLNPFLEHIFNKTNLTPAC